MEKQNEQRATAEQHAALSYEAPRIEMILTAEELEREVFYAGNQSVQ